MEERQDTERKQDTPSTEPKVSLGSTVKGIISLVCIGIFLFQAIPMFFPVGGNSMARKEAELHVQNSIYATVGVIPAVESKVVYKNKDYICVGVRYALDKADLKKSHWARVVCVGKRSEMVVKSTGDLSGIDVFDLSKNEIEQIKVLFKIH